MRNAPRIDSSGHIDVDGELYRLVERSYGGAYDVLRERDDQLMGSFAFEPGTRSQEPAVISGAAEPDLVRKVARLLATPRGLLPIQ